jgi:two-component system sensor histidine kinase KdpD
VTQEQIPMPDTFPAAKPTPGRLKVFLGYSSGVGKTFRMLGEARRRKERGEDVVVAAHQPGAQAEIRTLLDKLEIIPPRRTAQGEVMDTEAVLRRRPQVCVIDPLARNNPFGARHPWRWQDVEELLLHSISVLTAVNLLHIDDLREQVEAVTGKHTRETVPREFLARADEIVVVDVPAQVALERKGEMRGGGPERQLSELREMALVLAAEVADIQLRRYLEIHGIKAVGGVQERILVCVTPHSDGAAMIASGQRNKERFHGELHVIYVRQPGLSPAAKDCIRGFLRLAREAGAEVQVLDSPDPVTAILEHAWQHQITQIFVGHSGRGGWLSRFWSGPLERLLRGADQMDVRIFPQ